jgi:transposase-like protein
MDETFVRIAGRGQYLFRAVDSQRHPWETRDREAGKHFLKKAWRIPTTARPASWCEMACAVIPLRSVTCKRKV